jgi:hypothetical protein
MDVFKAIPVEFHYQIFANLIEYEIAIQYLCNISTNTCVKFTCQKCNGINIMRWRDLERRKYHKYDNICSKCLNKLIQNNPEKLEANKNNAKKLWYSEDYKSRCLRAFESHNKKMQLDPKYANKHRRKSKSVTGKILIDNQLIIFDSAFELIFLWSIRGKYNIIRRCDFAIAYNNHFYHPDFLVVDNDNNRIIIEVKGFYKNNIIAKQKAAEQYIIETNIADSYILYDTERLLSESILHGIGGAYMWKQIKEINHEAIISFTDPKHQRIAEIGINRFRKEIKNQEYV